MSPFDFVIRFRSDGVDQLANTVKGKIGHALHEVAAMGAAAAAGYIGVEGIKARIEATVSYATSIKDLSEQTGASTDKLQEWEYAANRMGMSIQEVILSFNKLKLARESALSGKAGNQDASDFAALGISTSQLKNMSPEQTFNAVGQALSKVSDEANTARLSVNLFGREGIRFTNALKNGFIESANSAKALGIVISEDLVNKIDVADKRMALFNLRARGAVASGLGTGMGVWNDVNSFFRGIGQTAWTAYYDTLKNMSSPKKNVSWSGLKSEHTRLSEAFGEGAMTSDNEYQNLELELMREMARAVAKSKKGSGLFGLDSGIPKNSTNTALGGFGGGGLTQADALTRIGLFRGGTPDSTRIAHQQLAQLVKAVEKLSSIDHSLTYEES